MDSNLMWLITTIIMVASLITAITVIIKAVKTISKATDDRTRNIAKEEIEKSNTRLLETNAFFNNQLKDTLLKTIDDSFKVVSYEIGKIGDDLNSFIKEQTNKNNTLTLGHIETWKKDIRDIYFHLRRTGEISDDSKSYADKIYHVYKELGGNSDIDAKYKEICEVYSRITHKRYEEMQRKQEQSKAEQEQQL